MANNLLTNPIYIDTFSSDVTISEVPLHATAIVFWSTGADDKLILKDRLGVPCVAIHLATAKDTFVLAPCKAMEFTNGLVLDVSDGTYTTASKLLIYLE